VQQVESEPAGFAHGLVRSRGRGPTAR
jgi:hypothetical protein